MVLKWVAVNNGENFPKGAIVAGKDIDGKNLYVARASHAGDLVPGKIIHSAQQARISYGTNEILKNDYDVLTGTKYTWIASSVGNVPPNAVVGGLTSEGEILYVGRTAYNNSVQPGKVHKSHGCFYFPYGDAERKALQYDVLCNVTRSQWVQSNATSAIPEYGHVAGNNVDGSPIYVGRATHEGNQLPANVIPSKNTASVCYAGLEIQKTSFDVLCQGSVNWVKSDHGAIPQGAVSAGVTKTGETVYIGRGEFIGCITIGKVDPSNKKLYIPFGGSEVPIKNFEILVEPAYDE